MNGWHMNQNNLQNIELQLDDELVTVVNEYRQNAGFQLNFSGVEFFCRIQNRGEGNFQIDLGECRFKVVILHFEQTIGIIYQHQYWEVKIHDSLQHKNSNVGSGSGLTAPMPGSVIDIKVVVGEQVNKGHELMVIEAMKMEHTITATENGIIDVIHFDVGDQVEEGEELLSLTSISSGD